MLLIESRDKIVMGLRDLSTEQVFHASPCFTRKINLDFLLDRKLNSKYLYTDRNYSKILL